MGFCRRCGDIVNGQRCNKCGGSVVAPAINWNQVLPQEEQDKWSKTYVSRERSISPVRPKSAAGRQHEGPPNLINSPTSSAKLFPRAMGAHITGTTALDDRITDHIASASIQSTRPALLKPTVTGPKPESGILPSLNDSTLSKVYGSVLQPKESLTTHSCATCATPFLPDATIYPDPTLPESDEPRFLCRQCFIVGGGSKGLCPTCFKPVTILKAEGGFVYAADKYWHKKCFNCEGCAKNIGNSPMLDLLGRPSCSECFDTCLSREPLTPKRSTATPDRSSPSVKRRNLGGCGSSNSNVSKQLRESSSTIEELEQRLGIARSREGSPAIEELSQRLNSIGKDLQYRASPTSPPHTQSGRFNNSPNTSRRRERLKSLEFNERIDSVSSSTFASPRRTSNSPAPTTEAVEEMKKRFLRYSMDSPASSTSTLSESSPAMPVTSLRPSRSSMSLSTNSTPRIPVLASETLSPSPSLMPDLISDFSDTLTQSSFSGVDSPPRTSETLPSQQHDDDGVDLIHSDEDTTEETKSVPATTEQTCQSTVNPKSDTLATSTNTFITEGASEQVSGCVSATTRCAKCDRPLFALKEGGRFVTVPGQKDTDTPQTFHEDCFRCAFCDYPFKESVSGQAMFVKSPAGPAHVECAPPEKVVIRKAPSAGSLRRSNESMLPKKSAASKIPLPSSQKNNNYHGSSRFERPFPTTPTTTPFPRFGSRTVCPGCNKSVSPMEKGVVPGPQSSKWHADCLVCGGKRPPSTSTSWMLGRGEEKKKGPGCGKKLDSAAKADNDGRIWCRQCLLMLGVGGSPQTSPTGVLTSSGAVPSQLTGTTTLARQFTGLGGGDPGLFKQLTGGSISPTRSLSPTKQLNQAAPGIRPRPKSVIGMRSSKSVDEGRGMFLVRNLTDINC